jgi:hypothetical protein
MRLHCHCLEVEQHLHEGYYWLLIALVLRTGICEKSDLFYENLASSLKTFCEALCP